jgi:hypothetical protein
MDDMLHPDVSLENCRPDIIPSASFLPLLISSDKALTPLHLIVAATVHHTVNMLPFVDVSSPYVEPNDYHEISNEDAFSTSTPIAFPPETCQSQHSLPSHSSNLPPIHCNNINTRRYRASSFSTRDFQSLPSSGRNVVLQIGCSNLTRLHGSMLRYRHRKIEM